MSGFTTPITEYLERHGVAYKLLPHSESVYTVEAAAAQRGVEKGEMVKCILLRESKKHRYVMACVTGDARLNPQAVRAALAGQWKRLSFASGQEIETITGFVQGAVAPLCLPASLPLLFDQAISRAERVNISSGDPMAGLELKAADLIRLSQAQLASIAAN